MYIGRNMPTGTINLALILSFLFMQLSSAANLPDDSSGSNTSCGELPEKFTMVSDSCCQGGKSRDIPGERKNFPDKPPCCPDGCKHCNLACCGGPACTIVFSCIVLYAENTKPTIAFLAVSPTHIESFDIFHPPRL